MPAPAATVLIILGTVAAAVAFKEFVYEPHLADKFERWAENYVAKRRAKRANRAGQAPISVHDNNESDNGRHGASGQTGVGPSFSGHPPERSSIELGGVHEWRSSVDRSQSMLRQRHTNGMSSIGSTLDSPNVSISTTPIRPTHVIYDPSAPATPTTNQAHSPAPVTFSFPPSPALTAPSLPPQGVSRSYPSPPLNPSSPSMASSASPDIDLLSSLHFSVSSRAQSPTPLPQARSPLASVLQHPLSPNPMSPFMLPSSTISEADFMTADEHSVLDNTSLRSRATSNASLIHHEDHEDGQWEGSDGSDDSWGRINAHPRSP